MEAGTFLGNSNPLFSHLSRTPKLTPLRPSNSIFFSPRSIRVSSTSQSQKRYRGPKPKKEWVADWVKNNSDTVRSLPIFIGGASLLAVLFNRAASGVAPVADAGSSQSRADLLTLGLAVTNILNGLVWLSIRPKSISVVNPEGVECRKLRPNLPESVINELLWVWESLCAVTCCQSLAIVYDCCCIMQIGVAANSATATGEAVPVDANKLMQGSLYQNILKSKAPKYLIRFISINIPLFGSMIKTLLKLTENYLANLALYPGRSELPFLPSNTQAVILQPLGEKGIAVIGGDMVRGFTTSDQAWIAYIGEKLDATLSKYFNGVSLTMQ